MRSPLRDVRATRASLRRGAIAGIVCCVAPLVLACSKPTALPAVEHHEVSLPAAGTVGDASPPEPTLTAAATPSFCAQWEAGGLRCLLPESRRQSDMDALRNVTQTTLVELDIQHGRECGSLTDFSALSTLPRLKALSIPTECMARLLATAHPERLEELE